MPTMSPYEVQGIMEQLEALQRLEAAGKTPPGSYDAAVQGLRTNYEFRMPEGSSNDGFTGQIGNPTPTRAPWRGEYDMPGNFERQQHMANSMANDAMLRELMSYRRARTSEDPGEGQYALARYPQLYSAIQGASGGMGGVGQLPPMGMSPQEARAYADKRKQWAADQGELIGMGRPTSVADFRRFREAGRGRGAREQMALFREMAR